MKFDIELVKGNKDSLFSIQKELRDIFRFCFSKNIGQNAPKGICIYILFAEFIESIESAPTILNSLSYLPSVRLAVFFRFPPSLCGDVLLVATMASYEKLLHRYHFVAHLIPGKRYLNCYR